MHKKLFLFIVLLGVFGSVFIGRQKNTPQEELIVFAASSLAEPVTAMTKAFSETTGTKITCTFDASDTLQKQIEEGATCHIFISAGTEQIQNLAPLLQQDTITPFLENTVVLVVPPEHTTRIQDFAHVTKEDVSLIALGSKDVPIGQYAREIFTNLGVWQDIQPKITFAGSAKEVVTQVAEGMVDCGVVYGTDAISSKLPVVAVASKDVLQTPVVYTAALLESETENTTADEFLNFLTGKESAPFWEAAQFLSLRKE